MEQRAASTSPKIITELPGPELVFVQERAIYMLERDWARIQREVKAVTDVVPWFRDAVSASAGAAVTTFVGWISWLPVYGTLSDATRAAYAWISPLLIVITVLFALASLISWLAHHELRGRTNATVKLIQSDMASIYSSPEAHDA